MSKRRQRKFRKLKDKNEQRMQMDGVKDRCEEEARENDVELEKSKKKVAEAEV